MNIRQRKLEWCAETSQKREKNKGRKCFRINKTTFIKMMNLK